MYTHSDFLCKLRRIKSRIFQLCIVCPFIWDPQRKLYVSNSKLKSRFNVESLIIPLLTLFQTYQLFYLKGQHHFNDTIFLSLDWLLNMLITTNTYIYIWKLDVYLGYVNGTILLGDGISRKFIKKIKSTQA